MHAMLQAASPFGMLTDPEATMRTIEAMQRSSSCQARICRPLDRVQVPRDDAAQAADKDVNLEEGDDL